MAALEDTAANEIEDAALELRMDVLIDIHDRTELDALPSIQTAQCIAGRHIRPA